MKPPQNFYNFESNKLYLHKQKDKVLFYHQVKLHYKSHIQQNNLLHRWV
ncbi:hypothetical protein LDVICp235 [lymphocystis disease virus-China]|uniref:Uncharacterized protein n=1 Tax=lymphocystis disease virus-China TaxID=256729 RepID=Q677M9_9VIRU|nr:hypothetical protein LDVICp235 [lymphocystis disease virus-China]AAU11078.1 hypothetical protein [lymphocystis disease virus-China]